MFQIMIFLFVATGAFLTLLISNGDEMSFARNFNDKLEKIFSNNNIVMTTEKDYENKTTNNGLVMVLYQPVSKKALYCLPENKKDFENRINYSLFEKSFEKNDISGNNTVTNYIYTESQSKLSYRLSATNAVVIGSGKNRTREYIQIEDDFNNFKCIEKNVDISLTKEEIINQIKWTTEFQETINDWNQKKHKLKEIEQKN